MGNKNLIYTCVFMNRDYINLLHLLMKSICLYSNIDRDNTDMLIYATKDIANEICGKLAEFNDYKIPIFFHTYEEHEIVCIMQACSCRLQIFNNNFIHEYEKILYIDTDILINGDINKLFNLQIDDDKIYATESGYIGHIYWGAHHFDFDVFDRETKGLCSGVMLFRNSHIIKKLFSEINDHIWYVLNNDQNMVTNVYDQPFINYTAIKQNKYDNQLINQYVVNNPEESYSKDVVIYHFLGGLGDGIAKYDKMLKYMERMETERL